MNFQAEGSLTKLQGLLEPTGPEQRPSLPSFLLLEISHTSTRTALRAVSPSCRDCWSHWTGA